VVWFIAFAFYLWNSYIEEQAYFYQVALEACETDHYAIKECENKAALATQPFPFWIMLGFDLGSIAIAWLIAWGIIGTVRWVRRGFA
jgi:hypothetical protein